MDKLDLLGWEAHTTLKLGEQALKIRSTSKAFNAWLGSTLKPYKSRKSAQNWYSVVIAGGDPDEGEKSSKRFHILYRGSSQIVRTLDLPTLARALFADLESVMFPERDDAVYVEAAPLAMNGRVGLVPGSYMTTLWKLSRRLHQAGIVLPLARTVAVDRESGEVVPTTPRLEVPEDAIDRLHREVGEEAAAALRVAGSRRDGNGHLERWVLRDRTTPTAVLTTGGEDGPRQPMSRGQAVYRLAAMTMNLSKVGVSALESLSLLATQAQCYMFFGAAGQPAQRSRLLNDITTSLSE